MALMGTPNASPMGQIYLGFRSLAVKLVVFFLMAAMLAWILGGTLWPTLTMGVVQPTVEAKGITFGIVDQIYEGNVTYGIARIDANGKPTFAYPRPDQKQPQFIGAIPPVVSLDGDTVAFGVCARSSEGPQWRVYVIEDPASWPGPSTNFEMIDQLEAARQLARFASGLAIQDEATQRSVRQDVLDADSVKTTGAEGSSSDALSGPN